MLAEKYLFLFLHKCSTFLHNSSPANVHIEFYFCLRKEKHKLFIYRRIV